MTLAENIVQTCVPCGSLALFYLAQAGFCIKTCRGTLIGIDRYLSDCCERLFGFKRLIPAKIKPADLSLDILAATHAHADHLDPDALPVFAKNPKTIFLGSPDCHDIFKQAGISESKSVILGKGETKQITDVDFRAIYADHGELAPEAIGLLMTVDGITVYHTGDTSLQVEKILASLGSVKIDLMIVPINGAFGNLNAAEACQLAAAVKPHTIVAAHFGMFAEHGGDPEEFLREAKKLPAGIQPRVLENGEKVVLSH
jgi:L-ascorbate 6-phosphate lactonase